MSLSDGSEGEGGRDESEVLVVPKGSDPGGCNGVK